jgi:hypothetical protein
MTRKLMVLVLAVILVVAVAIPVVAQERVVTPKLEKISKRALKKSKTALRVARATKRQMRDVEATAMNAAVAAADAKGAAGSAQAAIASTKMQSAVAPGVATIAFEELVPLPGGPSVQVIVPASGLIEVWAQATIDGAGQVTLFEDGQLLPGQSETCLGEEGAGEGMLFLNSGVIEEGVTLSTPMVPTFAGLCGTIGAPGPVLFQTTPGHHTYELRYSHCGCEEVKDVTFSNRRLFVAPRP